MDGIETIERIHEVDPDIELVICSAYSDYSWEDMRQKLKCSDKILILKKPFELIEIQQLAHTLTKKWVQKKQIANQINQLQVLTQDLDESLSMVKATLESTNEGILVLDKSKNVVLYNKVFQKIWDIQDDLLNTIGSSSLLNTMASQTDDPDLFTQVLFHEYDDNKLKNVKKWKLKSGKTIEIHCCLQYINGNVAGCVWSFSDITEAEELKQELLHQATHDSLTGLPNRALLIDRTHQAILQAKRFNLQVGVLLIDLDNFKQINDSYGHNAGDELLKLVANKLNACVSENDTVSRLGGDEFVVVLAAQATQESVGYQAKYILESLISPCQIANHELIITASIGISVYPKDGHDTEVLLKNADSALYYAKSVSRNTYQFYTHAFSELILKKLEMTSALRQAIQKKQFYLNYQPLFELHSGKIIGIEALIRWNHPTLGLVAPEVLIPIAEESGLINEIGEWVLRTACMQAKVWQNIYPQLKLAVNISVKQFQQKDFVETVMKILKETNFESKYLELELTENIILHNLSESIQKMIELKNYGINFAIDDFGTGYSCLSYLKYFAFDKIKIDKSFIEGLGKNSTDTSIVEAIIAIAKQHDITILAEGIEQEDQVQFMRKYHGSQVQGFYYSHPLAEQACTKLLMSHQHQGDEQKV